MNDIPTYTLRTSGARLHYELRGKGPLAALVGAPMDARSFAPIADLLASEYTVLTTDPRGINRSSVDDPNQDSTPQLRAEDLSRLLEHVDAGPAWVFGSSGGAVSVLALAQAHPEQVHTVIAHEPPLDELVEDREHLWKATEEMIELYLAGDVRGAWLKFLKTANIDLPEPVIEGMIGGERDPQDVADERFQYEHMLRATVRWQPDVPVLRSTPVRVVVGIGEDSAGQLCDRTSRALATLIGLEPTMFPGGHIGFAQDAATFAVRLREVLNDD